MSDTNDGPNFTIIENAFSLEQYDAMFKMQLHDMMIVTISSNTLSIKLLIIRVFGGYLYYKNDQTFIFVPEVKIKVILPKNDTPRSTD